LSVGTGEMVRTAIISDDGLYRYRLGRRWAGSDMDAGGMVYFIMLNPSTADAMKDDATIRRCIGFAKGWGFSRLLVGNLYAYRATDPKRLAKALQDPGMDAVGEGNDDFVLNDALMADRIVCAWGAHPVARLRAPVVLERLAVVRKRLGHLGLTEGGQPKHPLRLAKDTAWIAFG
jgi:hypothetical protein